MLLQLSLYVVCIIQLTSAKYKSDDEVTQTPENDGGVSSHQQAALWQLLTAVSQQHTALFQLQKDVSQLKNGLSQGQKEVKTGLSQVQEDVSKQKTSLSELQKEVKAGHSLLQKDVAELKDEIQQNMSDNCVPLLIQQNVDGSNFFNRSWAEFKAGFGDKTGNFWLGNERLSQLTISGRYKLRFDLESTDGPRCWAEYSTFIVWNETYNYQLHVFGYSGDKWDYDILSSQNGRKFSTYDQDNDQSSVNCAVRHGGGFWYDQCGGCYVNGQRGRGDGFTWYAGRPGYMYLKTSRMWMLCH